MIDYYHLPLCLLVLVPRAFGWKKCTKPKKEGTPFQIRLSSDVNRFRANGQEDAWICAELLESRKEIRFQNEIELTFTSRKRRWYFPNWKDDHVLTRKEKHVGWTCCNRISKLVCGENVICATADGVKSAKICIFCRWRAKTQEHGVKSDASTAVYSRRAKAKRKVR